MKKLIHKWFWAWDFDKEEKWLNEMAAKGMCLSSVGFCRYEFEECPPAEYTIRLELLENVPTHPESEKYLSFLEETGVEYVGSLVRWVYLKKKTDQGGFELFSDNASRIAHLNRILLLMGIVGGFNLYTGISNILNPVWTGRPFYPIGISLGVLNLGLSALIAYGLWKIWRKKKELKKQQQLFE